MEEEFEEFLKVRVPSGHTIGQYIDLNLRDAIRTALAQSTQSPGEQPPQTVAGDGAFKHPKYTTPELELLMKDLNGIPLYAMEDEKTHWQDGGKFQDRIFEAARKYYIAALTRHKGA